MEFRLIYSRRGSEMVNKHEKLHNLTMKIPTVILLQTHPVIKTGKVDVRKASDEAGSSGEFSYAGLRNGGHHLAKSNELHIFLLSNALENLSTCASRDR
jgi:hypothetical protein